MQIAEVPMNKNHRREPDLTSTGAGKGQRQKTKAESGYVGVHV